MGRPREFDADEALQTALELFWRKGYEGTSITDLTDGMGITKPSLYGAFGKQLCFTLSGWYYWSLVYLPSNLLFISVCIYLFLYFNHL